MYNHSAMIQYYIVLNTNIPQMSLACETRKATVETILECVTKGPHSNANHIVLNFKQFYSLVPFSSLVL